MNKKKILVMQIEMMVNKNKDIRDNDEKEKIFVTMIVTMQGERRNDLLPLLCPPHTVTFSNHHHSFLPEYQIFLLQQFNIYHITTKVRGLHPAQCISCHRL